MSNVLDDKGDVKRSNKASSFKPTNFYQYEKQKLLKENYKTNEEKLQRLVQQKEEADRKLEEVQKEKQRQMDLEATEMNNQWN